MPHAGRCNCSVSSPHCRLLGYTFNHGRVLTELQVQVRGRRTLMAYLSIFAREVDWIPTLANREALRSLPAEQKDEVAPGFTDENPDCVCVV